MSLPQYLQVNDWFSGQFDYTEYQCRSNRRGRMPVLLFYGSFESVLYPGLYITAHKNLELSLYVSIIHAILIYRT